MSTLQKTITCTVCPMGCVMTVVGDGENIVSVEGYTCKRGEVYARNEYVHPVRIFTSSVRLQGGQEPLVAVRSDRPIPKEELFNCMEALRGVTVSAPVHCGDVIVENILGTGANIIASGESES